MSVKAIILAAGQGTRMKSDLPKVLHHVAGRPLVSWALAATHDAGIDDVAVVVGHGAERVTGLLPDSVTVAVQEEQLGTGHAARIGVEALSVAGDDTVVVLPGDMPLLTAGSVAALLEARSGTPAAVLTAVVADPTGYGRVRRDAAGTVTGIIEEADATDEEKTIGEVSSGVFAFDAAVLGELLDALEPDNAQGEYYLPDIVARLAGEGRPPAAVRIAAEELTGVNSHEQLAAAGRLMRDRINRYWMAAGVAMIDPDRVYIDAGVVLEPGAKLYPGTHLEGATVVGADAEIGPDVFVRDSIIGSGSRIWYAVLRNARVAARVEVGPYASLRPGADLADESKAGTFVEIKQSTIGPRSKVPHLTYLGDATLGEEVNIGAGTITCNYDGFAKHRTIIGDRAFTGSDTMLVAPLEIGDDGWTGAGSVITQDVPSGALAVERSQQKVIPGYAERRRRKAQEGT
jgi:bifunctional UDP-N-acetylglucosamine pyrophosphorylase/glucosamine-1-phosphate N-acetyltransferase